MGVRQPGQSIGQTEQKSPKVQTEWVWHPLDQKVNAGLALLPHVRSDIQKIMGRDRPKYPSTETSANSRSQIPHRERH